MSVSDVYGNYYDKYRSKNPATRWFVSGFLSAWHDLVAVSASMCPVKRLLEVGCGDGFLLERTVQVISPADDNFETSVIGVGVEPGMDVLITGHQLYSSRLHACGSIFALPFPDAAFDLVTIPEVFEHLEDPRSGLLETIRVSNRFILASVPWEPVWRGLNLVRGAYWSTLGNTPGHIGHFSRREFIRFMSNGLRIVAIRRPFPWTIILAEKTVERRDG
ncbi:methyltransferase domain-containing protein [bacterium]|nr:methyltransferase domain-containing protein [candidate division CSSED10-310 bacterium]